ncbi:MAG: ATP synthase F0 subunit B [Chloroflexi bacterium]|nr:ATP synthase F0 subunit B [Chloroflexota bacterium]
MIAIDVLYLVDRLEALLNKGWRVPMSAKTMIDEDEFLDIVDQMRIAFPEEIKQAKKIVQERERIVAQAQEEAKHIIETAKEDAARLTNDHAIVKTAQAQAAQIERQAQAEAAARERGADQYATQLLKDLHARLEQFAQQIAQMQTQVYNGLNVLQEPPPADAPPPRENS